MISSRSRFLQNGIAVEVSQVHHIMHFENEYFSIVIIIKSCISMPNPNNVKVLDASKLFHSIDWNTSTRAISENKIGKILCYSTLT